MSHRFPIAIAICGLLLAPIAARADNRAIARARAAYDQLRYEDVLREAAAARAAGGLSREDDVALTELEARAYAIFDDRARAVAAFKRLLALDPGFRLTRASPKIARYYDEARAATRPPAPLANEVRPAPASSRSREARTTRWWLWAGISTAAAAAIATTVVVLVQSGGNDDGNLGTLPLP